MWWIVFLYIVPGILTMWLLPQFMKYNGGQDVLKTTLENYKEEYWNFFFGFVTFCPILNLCYAVLLICWYIKCILNS